MFLIICSLIIILIYIIHISIYLHGYFKIKVFNVESNHLNIDDKVYLSVLIAVKNEEKNLPDLLLSLQNQTLHKQLFEIIFINDHSNDNSRNIINNTVKDHLNFKYIDQEMNKFGKKEAILKGVSIAKGELIVTTDADCKAGKFWLETILKYYLKFRPKMIIGPVFMKGKGFFDNMQSLEFSSLSGTTAGSAGIFKPIMCNGANLAYQKELIVQNKDVLKNSEQSGDDIFLMHYIKKSYPKQIHFLKSQDAVVYTKAEPSIKNLFRQRIRWASKSKAYKDHDTIFTSLLVFIINTAIILLVSLSFREPMILKAAIMLFVLKSIIDFIILLNILRFFKRKDLLKYFLPLSIIYPFYITITAIASLLTKNIRWK